MELRLLDSDFLWHLQALKQERRSSTYLENIINKAQKSKAGLEMAIITVDRNDHLDWWSKVSESLLGLRCPEDRRLPVTNLIRDPSFTECLGRNVYDKPLHISVSSDNSKKSEIKIALFGEN
ncbi:MAG: hypothetical protein CMD92_04190 [Gammaproteobacteria bacterium]|nr:hypothetical protein [Gammaproteobacteria bacterium]HBW83497.1 hypothetical protein [Gammaproteobacteria bacterium]|tara:strand:- start:1148 stop:1513 length:366 start_codon:yes stop_codon:yes gene_type:complete